jgi:3',5'-cyclic AMP phosphodiesterase CpdA
VITHQKAMLTLAHLSDPHLAPLPEPSWSDLIGKRMTGYINWQKKRRFVHDPAVLSAVAADIRAQAPDHIAVTGDIANIALPAEFSHGRDWLESLGSAQNVTFVPGNHDIYVREAGAFAARQWGPYMCDDNGEDGFPFVRRRGNVALIGLSTGVPTAPFLATGWLGTKQLAEFAAILNSLKDEDLFRIVLIHHPPVSDASRYKRLMDASILKRIIAAHGADLLLHGHDHARMINWLHGPKGTRIPAIGVPSASSAPGRDKDAAGYNLYRIDGSARAWRCDMISRGLGPEGTVVQQDKIKLIG